MRRIVRRSMRGAILLLLALAVADPSLPGAGPRRRVYVIDVSASVAAAPGADDSFTPDDALRLATHDLHSLRSDDEVALIAFAAMTSIMVPLMPVSKARFPARLDGLDA